MTAAALHFLKITDEMKTAFRDAWVRSMSSDPRTEDPEGIADAAGIEAVLAIVERDHAIGPAMCDAPGHPKEPLAYCELPRGHEGRHSATVERAVDW